MKARLTSALLLTALIFLSVIPLRQNVYTTVAASSQSELSLTDQVFSIEGDTSWIAVDVLIDYGNGTSKWSLDVMLQSGATALDATLAVATFDYTMHNGSVFVYAINEVENIQPNSWMWWHWNSTESQWEIDTAACSNYILADRDILAWLYENTIMTPFAPPALPLFLRVETNKDSYYSEENVLATAMSVCGRTPVQNGTITAEIDFPNSTMWLLWANTTDADGLATLQFHLPSDIPAGQYSIYASGFRSDLGSTLSTAEFHVLPSNHDLAIMKIEPLTATVPVAAEVNIDITILNKGDFTETFTLRIFANNTEIGNTSASLNSEESNSYSFVWTPTVAGSFVISAEIPPVADEIHSADNILTGGTVTVQKSSISVSIAVSQETIALGKAVMINGSVAPTKTGTKIAIQYSLSSDWSTLTTVTTDSDGKYSHVWTPAERGVYQLKARWDGDSSTEPAESGIVTVEVQPMIHDVAVSGVVAPTEAVPGGAVTITVTLSNLGDYDESVTLDVSYNTTIIENRLLSIASKTSKTAGFTWSTADAVPGFYDINAEAAVTTDDNIANNKAATSIWIKSPPPLPAAKGTLAVITTPISAEVFVNEISWGTAPQSRTVEIGAYNVSFGSVAGYLTPTWQIATVDENLETTTTGFYETEKVPSHITIGVNPTSVIVGSNITISGTITPGRAGADVTIFCRSQDATNWIVLATVQSNSESCYTHRWETAAQGTYEIKAGWKGDSNTLQAESIATTAVVTALIPKTSILIVTTSPVAGEVFVNGAPWGPAPVSNTVQVGEYEINFGSVVGFSKPAAKTVTIAENTATSIEGIYEPLLGVTTVEISKRELLNATDPFIVDLKEKSGVYLVVSEISYNVNVIIRNITELEGVEQPSGMWKVLGCYVQIIVNNTEVTLSATIRIYYTSEQLKEAGLDESTLTIHYWNATSEEWAEVKSQANLQEYYVEAVIGHFSFFAVMGKERTAPTALPWWLWVGVLLIAVGVIIVAALLVRRK